MRRALLLVALLVVAAAACSRSSGSATTTTTRAALTLRLDLVPAAVTAVEAALGGPQQYTEINAFEQGVNLFVATADGKELPYVYRDGTGLEAPPAPGFRPTSRPGCPVPCR